MRCSTLSILLFATSLSGCGGDTPMSRDAPMSPSVTPVALWDGLPQGQVWTAAVSAAIAGQGQALILDVPADAAEFCPGFADAGEDARTAFWVSFLSALAGEESTWRENVSGGNGRWHGLLQISSATAAGYGCEATSADGLKSGAANLACGVTIMAQTVARDGVIADGGGVAADWGPLTRAAQKDKIAAYTRAQTYCQAQ